MATPNDSSRATAHAIVVAAGSGSRMAAPGPRKPFLQLGQRTLLEHSCSALAAAPEVIALTVVAQPADHGRVNALLTALPLPWKVVAGGRERFGSVLAGVQAAGAACDVLAIHDAARPLVLPSLVSRTIRSAAEHGAAYVAVPVIDSVHSSAPGAKDSAGSPMTVAALERSELWAAQTPQAFRTAEFIALCDEAADSGHSPTDEVALWETRRGPVQVVVGSRRNLKITTTEDLILARAFLESEGEDTP